MYSTHKYLINPVKSSIKNFSSSNRFTLSVDAFKKFFFGLGAYKTIDMLKSKEKSIRALAEEIRYNIFKFGVFSIPHYKKRAKGGEDASFQSENLLIVADGVGGWNNVGIDPSAYSKRLCELIAKNFIDKEEDLNLNIDENFVKDLITKSVRENGEKGSSTVCVLYMANNTVHSGYLGDSCFLIVRPKTIGSFELLFKSKEQTHGFNIPFQVGSEGDDPSCAVTANHVVQRDDVIILATDGLWDNMEVDTIIEELNNYSIFNKSVSIDTNDFAKKLSQKAEELSFKKDYKSPFARRAVEHNEKYKTYTGGKPDDITVIVAQISNTKNNLIINDTVPH